MSAVSVKDRDRALALVCDLIEAHHANVPISSVLARHGIDVGAGSDASSRQKWHVAGNWWVRFDRELELYRAFLANEEET